MSDKQTVIELVQGMPDDVSVDAIIEELATIAAIRRGIRAGAEGRSVSHEEAKRLVGVWTS